MGTAYRLVKPVVTFESYVEGIRAIRKKKGIRLTTSPFGLTPEQYANDPPIYVGDSVPWKGVEGIQAVRALNSAVADGLEKAIAMSKRHAGEKGITLYNGKLYPVKCINQHKEGKHKRQL